MFRTWSRSALLLAAGWCACVPDGPAGEDASGAGSGGSPPAVLCREACLVQFPEGKAKYEALSTCLVCGACHDVCAADAGGSCGEVDLGCSAEATDCTSCIASPCALEQKPDTSFSGACALEGAECATSSDCVGLNNCVAACVVTTGPGGSGATGSGGGDAAMSATASSASGS